MSAAIPSFFDENPGDMIRQHRLQYLIVNATARRVRQLQLGERAQAFPPDGSRDLLHIATQELLEDKLDVFPKQMFAPMDQVVEEPLDVAADYDDLGLSADFGDEEI
ncbi:MAG: DNA-directed RNA polymerase subunit omega [Candidatus Sumerlaeaceae bacterium]